MAAKGVQGGSSPAKRSAADQAAASPLASRDDRKGRADSVERKRVEKEGVEGVGKVEVLDLAGKKVGERDLDPAVFDVQVNVPVMHQVVVAGLAAARAGTHSTKTRAEVRGGGRKPWRQKGTGRARHGSIRSPIWVGGGVAHGPKPRSYAMRVPKKMKRLALRSALTDRARLGRIRVVEELSFEEPKTSRAAEVLGFLSVEGRVLLVIPGPDIVVEKSFRNLPFVRITYPGRLSAYEVLAADWVVFTAAAFDEVRP